MPNKIHPTAIIENCTIGEYNTIGPYCVIKNCVIGSNNKFESHVSVGAPAEHHSYFFDDRIVRKIHIGNNNIFREFVTVNAPTTETTQIGNQNIFLRGSHVSHDTIIQSFITISCSVLIGGESFIQSFSNIGLGAALHQKSVIGAGSMIGMNAVVPKKKEIKPFCVYVGNPVRYLKENTHAIQKYNVSNETIEELQKEYDEWFAKKQC